MSAFSKIVGPSELHHDPINWNVKQHEFGINFPSDYKKWAGEYNTIALCDELLVYNYADSASNFTAADLTSMMEVYEEPGTGHTYERDEIYDSHGAPMEAPEVLPLYPQNDGLVLWGTSPALTYFWDSSDSNPDRWNVVLTDGESYWQEFDCGFMEFLIRLVRHDLEWGPGAASTWPWIPAIVECTSRDSSGFHWNVPERWAGYFAELERRRETGQGIGDLSSAVRVSR